MTANLPAEQSATTLSEEAQAFALWTFVHLRTPRFTNEDALTVIRELAPQPGDDPKQLATHLAQALQRKGLRVKRANAVIAASRLLGHDSWHAGGQQASLKPLSVLARGDKQPHLVAAWSDAVKELTRCCEVLLAGGAMRVFRVRLTPTSLVLEQPYSDGASGGGAVELLRVEWTSEEAGRLGEAVRAAESIRRRFEEPGRALVDGVAAPFFSVRAPHETDLREDDPCNSELVVVDLAPGAGFGDEIARGDELRCWHELRWLHEEVLPQADAEGHWTFDKSRYAWRLTTIRAEAAVPEIITRPLAPSESESLLRRYRLAARVGLQFPPEDRVKRLRPMRGDYFQVAVDWERVTERMTETAKARHALEEALPGLAWSPRLRLPDFVKLVNWLELQRPQEFIRKLKRSELTLLEDDEMLRAFFSRVQDVVQEVPRSLPDSEVKQVEEAVAMLHLGLRTMDVVMPDGNTLEFEARSEPYMVHANAGRDLLDTLKRLGLVAYAGLTTNVKRGGTANWVTDPFPFELQHVLFLDIDYAGERNGAK